MTRRRPDTLADLRARFARLHGPLRAEAAYRRALLGRAAAVLEEVIRRRERAERFFELARRDEDDRWSALLAAAEAAKEKPPRRPAWSADTWRVLASLAMAKAKEEEWFSIVGGCMKEAARAIDVLRPPRQVVMYGNDGEPRTVFHVEQEEKEEA